MYVASKYYKILCEESCFHVKNIKKENKLFYETIQDGLNDGCQKCKHCLDKQ